MRKIICLLISLLFMFLCSCDDKLKVNVIYYMTTPDNETPIYTGEVKLKQYIWYGWGIDTKIITGQMAELLISQLDVMPETDEIVTKISDSTIDENSYYIPVKPGTLWIEANDNIYRVDPGYTQICRVNGYLGEGNVLKITEVFKKELDNAWRYWPNDCWSGTYEKGQFNISHVYVAETNIQVIVKQMYVERSYNAKNKITVELVSSIDQTITVSLDCKQGYDNLGEGDRKILSLVANRPYIVDLSFGGFGLNQFWIYINAGNTRLTISINPYIK